MKPHAIGGLVLIVLGVVALSIRGITYFSTDQVLGPLGFFVWDVSRPHTIFINPITGLAAIVIGVVLFFNARRAATI